MFQQSVCAQPWEQFQNHHVTDQKLVLDTEGAAMSFVTPIVIPGMKLTMFKIDGLSEAGPASHVVAAVSMESLFRRIQMPWRDVTVSTIGEIELPSFVQKAGAVYQPMVGSQAIRVAEIPDHYMVH